MVLHRPDPLRARARSTARAPSPRTRSRIAGGVLDEIRRRRVLALMLGDTSMGMINGYFGPRLLYPIGFSEHKVDQAWLIDRRRSVSDARVDEAFRFVQDRGRDLPLAGGRRRRLHAGRDPRATPRTIWPSSTCWPSSSADCLGWQYQLGLLTLLPPSDFAEGLLNSHARPEGDGEVVITSTEADQGNLVPMELMKRLLRAKGLPGAVMFHDVRWGARHDGRFLWVLLNSGSCGAYAFNHDVRSLAGVHSYRQPAGYFPVPGGTFAGDSLPGAIDLGARLDRPDRRARHGPRPRRVGRVARRRPRVLVARHDPAMAVHGRRPRLLDGNGHGPLHEQSHRRRLRRHLRRDGGPVAVAGLQGPGPLILRSGGRRELPRPSAFRRGRIGCYTQRYPVTEFIQMRP